MGSRARTVTFLLVAALAALGAFLALRSHPTPIVGTGLDEGEGPESAAPSLVAGPGALPAGAGPRAGPTTTQPEAPSTTPAESVLLEGVVLDDETGRPIEGATVVARRVESHGPRTFPAELVYGEGPADPRLVAMTVVEGTGEMITRVSVPTVAGRTDAAGAFALPWIAGQAADLWARRKGYVVGSAFGQPPEAGITIRLLRGLKLEGHVLRENGTPIAGVGIGCRPDPSAQGELGHRDATVSDERGAFALEGLLPGPVRLDLEHPLFMPLTSLPIEPPARDLRFVLVPAFLARIRLSTDDAKEPDAPTASWITSGTPPREGLVLLRRAEVPHVPDAPTTGPAFPTTGTYGYEPLRIPCDRPSVTITVKSVGYEPWTSEPIELPRDGGAHDLAVALRRDPDLGLLRLRFEGQDGRALSYVGEGCDLEIGRRDAKEIPGGIVLKPSEVLEMPALPSGPYRLRILSPGHAPVLLEADVPAGGEETLRVVLGPPAKVHVRFTAPEVVLVRFLLRQGGLVARTYPEGSGPREAPASGAPRETDEQAAAAGADGLVLSGLASGRYTVEVVSPDLVASPVAVDLLEGETKEVEISVSRK